MKKLIVNTKGEIIFDGKIIDKKDINKDFLKEIMIFSLKSELEFDLDENQYISILFKKIKEECDVDTSFYKEWNDNKEIYKYSDEELKKIENDSK